MNVSHHVDKLIFGYANERSSRLNKILKARDRGEIARRDRAHDEIARRDRGELSERVALLPQVEERSSLFKVSFMMHQVLATPGHA